ncbi:cytochrome P450 monooxygenase GliC2 [Nannizzia gypsea CBS 118893]|uniref:Cytochrome P450 monooxygenase GliC2 n=1 Tax=Arthroderma gypseum (strain ATCC MYA-4604 / CBS 118893) TaxID=535722 RepID=E4V757_ARTGP|nr:cytochrome P450 monooxygenase GliC2 [Nannizzia gypsea CBS 118893]EFQ96923.1 cytochrome P450 monooxygenase GliC2 [Nannizzia gypsea CBS 118893]
MESLNTVSYLTMDPLPLGIGAILLLTLGISAILVSPNTVADVLCNAFLTSIHRIYDESGKRVMTGPRYQFPNGQMVDKFLNAKNKSWEWEEKYGKTYRIWAANIPEVVITDPKDVEALYRHSTDHLKASQANAGWLLTQLLGSGLGLINGIRWTGLRKALDPTFSHQASMNLLRERLDNGAASYAADIHKFALVGKQGDTIGGEVVINATEALQRYPFFEVASIFYDEMSENEQERLWELGRCYSAVFASVVMGGIHRLKLTKYLNTDVWKKTQAYQRAWRQFNDDMYESRKIKAPSCAIVTLIDAAKRGYLTQDEVYDTIAESTFANLDIVTQVISSCVILLADAPNVQVELLSEMQENSENKEAYIARKDTLLHYCLMESLRLRPVLTFTFPENPPREKKLGGFIIPKDTTIIVDAFAINIRNPFWGPDSRSYRPSRFATIKQNQLRYNLATYGYGPRKCLGQHIADKLIKSVVYHLFTRYQVSLEPMQALDGEFKLDKTSWVGLYDVNLRLKPRSGGS